jgi:hypothetical protein
MAWRHGVMKAAMGNNGIFSENEMIMKINGAQHQAAARQKMKII